MENTVFLQLRRMQEEIFYYKTTQEYEVDFFLPKKNVCIQVSRQITEDIKDREVRALIAAAKEQKSSAVSIIVTEHDKRRIKQDGMTIQVVTLYEWLLRN
jgi:predicted AAA+ superfamily ATPase